MSDEPSPALKEMFNAARYRRIADAFAEVYHGFDRKRFIALTTVGLDPLTLIQRMRRVTEASRLTLPHDFIHALEVLKRVAPLLDRGFTSIFLPDFIGLYGHDYFQESMDALKFFTPFSSSEFAIREFLKRDLSRTLSVMEEWSHDSDEHVRRLTSEGCRPRLPWSFRLEALIRDPSPTLTVLKNLRSDPSPYVQKSVANHLNDISKDHPEWMLDLLNDWDLKNPHTAWIARHASRSLIKAGHPRSFRLFGFAAKPAVKLSGFKVTPTELKLGDTLHFTFKLRSLDGKPQKLAIDYTMHYRKKSGKLAPKVFKLKESILAPRTVITVTKRQRITDFTTRTHHPGRHRLEIMVNGRILARRSFNLSR